MVSSVRHTLITNGTGAAVVAGGASIDKGQDYAGQVIDRLLVAADVGAGAGQTQHAAGMIFAEFKGAVIKRVVSADIVRTAANYDYFFLGTDAVTANIGFRIITANGVSTLRLRDGASGAAGFMAADDHILVLVELGNS